MRFLSLFKNTQVFKIALGIAIVVVGYIASVFYSKMQKLNVSIEQIDTSNQTQLELETLLSMFGDYETNLRTYIITSDENYLKDRFLNRGEIKLNLQKIKKLAADNPKVRKNIDSLEVMLNHRFILFRQTVMAARSADVNKPELYLRLQESANLTNQMRSYVYNVMASEAERLKELNNKHQFELEDSIISAFLLVVLSLLILLLSFNKINSDVSELKKTNDELKFLNESFNNAEKVAGFGHWKLNLETGLYTFSDNYYRLMGVEPQSFAPTLSNALKYIHPDDLDFVKNTHLKSLENRQPSTIVVRYILDDGSIKWITSVGSFTKNTKGQLVKVGVNYDITDLYTKTNALEENNRELKAINEELEAFNNIVSHDLQEPLRKIQMFISRLEENTTDVLSEQSKGYFSKIGTAANRMQSLMMDLVNYTRTIKGDKVFVKTNLNNLLEQIIEDLSLNIEEKNAKVTVKNLPAINAIPFQIEQLFINLISNALKYSKDDVAPEINIRHEKIVESDICDGIEYSDKNYHKIVVSDNGIGFKQEYAEKIFMLFQRLETNVKYSGTGIGLAICKKIIENHNGCISVKSNPNDGATFSIYFPKW